MVTSREVGPVMSMMLKKAYLQAYRLVTGYASD
jgi:hypothetical protein